MTCTDPIPARRTYEIGGTIVVMTPAAAAAWNDGDLSETTLADAEVCHPDGTRTPLWRWIDGLGAWPDAALPMEGADANLIGDA